MINSNEDVHVNVSFVEKPIQQNYVEKWSLIKTMRIILNFETVPD